MITGYLEKIEHSESDRLGGQPALEDARHSCTTEEDWFGRWLGFLAITCPGPLTESGEGKTLDHPALLQRRPQRNGV